MYTEIKYLNMLSPRLEKFKKKGDYLWNFRCPICGDSKRNKTRARGFVFQLKGTLLYKCHNCQHSVPFPKLLEELDPVMYKQYRLEKFKDNNSTKPDMRRVKKIVSTTPVFRTRDILYDLTPIDELNNSHPAKEYLLTRKLPTKALYFTEKFKEWTNHVKPGTFQEITQDEPRIIIPFIDQEGVVFGFQGRSLHNSGLRYITILIDEERPKIFGLNSIDNSETIFITEGPFDSLLLENALAMAGADVSDVGDMGDCVYVYDNEPRNTQITDRIGKHISQGHKVVIWPTNIQEKDINDMYLAGIAVNEVVQTNTYQGLTAKLKFNDWKK
mgnify:FL=1